MGLNKYENIFGNWHGDVDEGIKDHRPAFDKKAVGVCLHERLAMCWKPFLYTDPIYDYMVNR